MSKGHSDLLQVAHIQICSVYQDVGLVSYVEIVLDVG